MNERKQLYDRLAALSYLGDNAHEKAQAVQAVYRQCKAEQQRENDRLLRKILQAVK